MSGAPKRTSSAGGVVLNPNQEVLIVSQRGTSWSLPKGHIDEEEEELEAAKREIYEESGIKDLEFVKKLGTYERYKISAEGKGEDQSEIKTLIIYLFKTQELDLKPVDPENPEARWIKKEQVVDILTHPKDKEFFRSIMNEI